MGSEEKQLWWARQTLDALEVLLNDRCLALKFVATLASMVLAGKVRTWLLPPLG